MKWHVVFRSVTLLFLLLLTASGLSHAQGNEPGLQSQQTMLGAGFSYQGQLIKSGQPVNAVCDFRFTLFDQADGGEPVGGPLEQNNLNVTEGYFATTLDFGPGAFNGENRWLQTAVRCPGEENFTQLSPRVAIMPAPYALALPSLWIQPHAIAPSLIGGVAGNWVDADVKGATIGGGGSVFNANGVSDDYGTVSGGLGNVAGDEAQGTDNAELATVGGGLNNVAQHWAATIAGGASNRVQGPIGAVGGGEKNQALEWAVTISGGFSNTVRASGGVIGGGQNNTVDGWMGTIAGGSGNQVGGATATIGGGDNNIANGQGAVVGGGGNNLVTGDYNATIAGGYDNVVSATDATVGGGNGNRALDWAATISGGYSNTITSEAGASVVAGGQFNTVSEGEATVSGGRGNTASGWAATVSGGDNNVAAGQYAVVGGGANNRATGEYNATIAGGNSNVASATEATVGGGNGNRALAWAATVSGGYSNTIESEAGTGVIGGGQHNTVSVGEAVIGGGKGNAASGWAATVSGGVTNTVSAAIGAIGGGIDNTVGGIAATIPGGAHNLAQGQGSFAAGTHAQARHDGAFVWADDQELDFESTAPQQFRVRATGGVEFVSAVDNAGNAVTGVILPPGANAWNVISDRATKENFMPVNGQSILAKVAALPLYEYNIVAQDPRIRHIGPVAQDFHAAFGYGESNTAINLEDADGVALAAIQELYAENQALRRQVDALSARLDALEREGEAKNNAPWPAALASALMIGAALIATWSVKREGNGRKEQ